MSVTLGMPNRLRDVDRPVNYFFKVFKRGDEFSAREQATIQVGAALGPQV